MVSHKNYNLSDNEGFVIFLTSMLITCFTGAFTLKMKSQLIAYLLNVSEHIYLILDLEGEVHTIWHLWISGLQECKGNGFFEVGRVGNNFRSSPKTRSLRTLFGLTNLKLELQWRYTLWHFRMWDAKSYQIWVCTRNWKSGVLLIVKVWRGWSALCPWPGFGRFLSSNS